MTSDTIVGVVGAIVLTGAMVVVFVYEKDQVEGANAIGTGDQTFAVAWMEETWTDSFPGDVGEGEEADGTFEVPAHARHIHITLSWEDDQPGTQLPTGQTAGGGPDEFELEVHDDNMSQVGGTQSGAGDLVIAYEVEGNQRAPANGTVRGDSQEDARAQLDSALANLSTEAQGVWHWIARLTSTGDSPTDPLLGMVQPDNGNSFTVSVRIDYWAPQVAASS